MAVDGGTAVRPGWHLVPGPILRRLLLAVAIVALIAAVVGCVAHFWAADTAITLGVVAATPYLLLGAPIGLVAAALARHRLAAAAGVVLTVVGLVTQAGLYVATTAPRDADHLVVMTSNLKLGGASPSAVVDAVRRHHVEVLMLQELTPELQAALIGAGLDRVLPFRISEPRSGAAGTGLWSAYPLTDTQRRTGFTFAFVTARVEVPGVADRPTLVALHLAGPVPDATAWRRDVARLPAVLDALPGDAPVLVGGDFNATPDTVQFRDVLTDGYADAADQAGVGRTETYPADQHLPPLIAIDHVLTRGGAVATGATTVHISGTDHRALVTSIAVPRARQNG